MLSPNLKYFRSCGAALAITCAWETVGRNFLLSVANAQEQLPSFQGTALCHATSPWGMFMNADVVVKFVMVGLIIASIVTWTVWLAKTIDLMKARRQVRAALDTLNSIQILRNVNAPS